VKERKGACGWSAMSVRTGEMRQRTGQAKLDRALYTSVRIGGLTMRVMEDLWRILCLVL
jgi:hypothetical protein